MFRIIALLTILLFSFSAEAKDKALERILKNKEINCGVYVLGSIFSYNERGKPTGFTVDLMNEVSKRTGYKVKYTEISSFATLEQDMSGGKFDMICTPVLFFPPTMMRFLPSIYITQDVINIYADHKADISKIKTLDDLNTKASTFVGMDGELGGMYVPKMFPKAKLTMIAQGSSPAQMFLELETKKADYIILTRLAGKAFLKQQPGKIKLVMETPIVSQSVHLFYPIDSYPLKANIDAVLTGIEREGLMAKMLTKHDLVF